MGYCECVSDSECDMFECSKFKKYIRLKDCSEPNVEYTSYELDFKTFDLDEIDKGTQNLKLENIAKRKIIRSIKGIDTKIKLLRNYHNLYISDFYFLAKPYL